MQEHLTDQVIIVGGGTAGWLTAGILAAQHVSNSSSRSVTLIQSPDVPTLGVGEGTWPTMRSTLQRIGISETQFLSCCDASFKQGSQFVGWVTGNADDQYYHPFMAPTGFGQDNVTRYWDEHMSGQSFAHSLSTQAHLCDHFLAPKQYDTPDYAALANYGYHLNADKFAALLQYHCTKVLGVNLIEDHVEHVQSNEEGYISGVVCRNSGLLPGGLFVDCSGSKGLLIGEHYQIPTKSVSNILFNDRAVAVQVPYSEPDSPIASHTISTAQKFGWIWDIGLTNRRGVGCVYSSQFGTTEQATQALRDYLGATLDKETLNGLSYRELSFEPSYREKFWHKNCVAVGMAAGFIEPLEASALAMVELSANMISAEWPSDWTTMEIIEERFNRRFHYRWERVIEFLKLHYVLSEREDSDYWKAHKSLESIPHRLKQLLTLWREHMPYYNDFYEVEELFPAASYHYILYGMQANYTKKWRHENQYNVENASRWIEKNRTMSRQIHQVMPTNRALLNQINEHYRQTMLAQDKVKECHYG